MEELPTLQELQSKMGNFTLAAQAANITQSAFSAQMKKLERLVGVKLIARSTRGSRLTPEGEKFLPEAEHIIETLERAIHSIRLANKLERPMLNVGILRSIGDVRMNAHVAYFQQTNPNFAISVYDMEEEEMLLDLRENRIDIGTCYLPNNKDMSAYESIALREDSVVYYAPNRKMDAHPVTCEEILDYPMVMYPPKYFMSHRLKSYFSEEGRQSLPQLVRLSNPYAMIDYCKRNESGALISRHLLEALGIEEGVYTLAKPLYLQVCFVYRNNNSKWETMTTFMDYIAQELKED